MSVVNRSGGSGSFAASGKVIAQHHYSADFVRRNGNPEIEQLAHIFTTLLPNIVGVGFNPGPSCAWPDSAGCRVGEITLGRLAARYGRKERLGH